MTSRHRSSAARPTASRSSVAPTPARQSTASDELPPYKKPTHPLRPDVQLELRALNGRSIAHLKDHNKKAGELITNAAGLINDKVREREEDVAKRRKKRDAGVEDGDLDEEEERLRVLQEKVDETTKQLEESMRAVIDGGVAAQRMDESLEWLRMNAPGHLESEFATQMSQRQTQSQSQRRRRTQGSDEDEDMVDDEEQEEEGPTPGPTPLDGSRPVLTGASELFTDRLARKKTEYTSISLGTRYSKNNAYIGFRNMVHDAKFHDDRPLAHPDTWFTESGSPAPGMTHTGGNADDDDDVVMDRATISTRCPLTFQKFKEPYSSAKCPHTFEKNAILEIIRASAVRVGGVGRNGERAVECPVPGCSQMLTASDLHHDPILIRKLKRMEEAEAQEAESEEEDEGEEVTQLPRKQQPRKQQAVKTEPASSRPQVPATQQPPRSSIVDDLGSPSGDDSDDYV